MHLRWLWFDHIPPELSVPKESRVWVRRSTFVHWNKDGDLFGTITRQIIAWMLFGGLCLIAVLIVEHGFNAKLSPFYLLLLIAAMIVIPLWFLGPFVRRALCDLGYLCCVKCGYPHTGLSKDVKECPECGTVREFGKCVHCNSPQDWAMHLDDRCTQCGRLRLS